LGDPTNIRDRYEIMAFAAEPRSSALGAVENVTGFTTQALQSIWSRPDPFQNNYKDHQWHSAQFRFTNMDQKDFWRVLLGQSGFNLQ
jgi:hypothetical protein